MEPNSNVDEQTQKTPSATTPLADIARLIGHTTLRITQSWGHGFVCSLIALGVASRSGAALDDGTATALATGATAWSASLAKLGFVALIAWMVAKAVAWRTPTAK